MIAYLQLVSMDNLYPVKKVLKSRICPCGFCGKFKSSLQLTKGVDVRAFDKDFVVYLTRSDRGFYLFDVTCSLHKGIKSALNPKVTSTMPLGSPYVMKKTTSPYLGKTDNDSPMTFSIFIIEQNKHANA